ncbi:MAG TPA: sulfate reduction electron transfer complex DsrMKJOP subunit DsrM [Dissulfurispiraceae bacterium]|nr:sulfate reduction electron transfer complex DsrMKJOP subunit DsrM [Dissulfurispiraceae bacterium]
MGMYVAFLAVAGLIVLAFLGVQVGLHFVFGALIPYLAIATFIGGVAYRVYLWSTSPVPFRIPTTAGQMKSLDWVKPNPFDNPSSGFGVLVRMALEVLLFRSLFRNTKTELHEGKLVHGSDKWLWLFGLMFHWAFLIIFVRHFRLFMENVPGIIMIIESLDGFFQVGVPFMYLTDLMLVAGATFLFLRRVLLPQIRYISLAADYFPLLLILAIALTGILMRYFIRVDITAVKAIVVSLFALKPAPTADVGVIFYIHLFLVSSLLIYFPFSKLMHMGGVFLSPTRNLVNNSREVRHVNPWNPHVHVHTYAEYEDEFRAKMKQVGIPVEKE